MMICYYLVLLLVHWWVSPTEAGSVKKADLRAIEYFLTDAAKSDRMEENISSINRYLNTNKIGKCSSRNWLPTMRIETSLKKFLDLYNLSQSECKEEAYKTVMDYKLLLGFNYDWTYSHGELPRVGKIFLRIASTIAQKCSTTQKKYLFQTIHYFDANDRELFSVANANFGYVYPSVVKQLEELCLSKATCPQTGGLWGLVKSTTPTYSEFNSLLKTSIINAEQAIRDGRPLADVEIQNIELLEDLMYKRFYKRCEFYLSNFRQFLKPMVDYVKLAGLPSHLDSDNFKNMIDWYELCTLEHVLIIGKFENISNLFS